ncbi:MAG: antitoxin VbhA family protein [Peptostreptococcaceae bacterium]|nr:antitoxin VbhA family protein [Peptostreptococcaceae bacterium]
MKNTDRIISNVCANMRMENMILTSEDKTRLKRCLEGESSYEDEVCKLVDKYKCV